MQRRLGFADPSGSGEGDQPIVAHERGDLVELRFSPDEGGKSERQVRCRLGRFPGRAASPNVRRPSNSRALFVASNANASAKSPSVSRCGVRR